MNPVMNYTDYRAFLKDLIEERKSRGLPCSNRWFAMKMEINSTSWLTSILNGQKGLSKITANKLSAILKHSISETRYFETLVAFNQAKTLKESNRYYQELCSIQKLRNVSVLSSDQYEYYSNWYNSVVRSLIGMYRFKTTEDDFSRIASMVSPAITVAQVRKSIALLEKLGLTKTDNKGILEPVNAAITSGENINSLAVANFQQETIRLAQEAIDRHPRKERYIGTVTVGVSAEIFEKIKQLLVDTNDKIAEIANTDNNADRVYQINLQAYPLSRKFD
jgi:uncharacterized protein (TIGR02147 family)